MANTKQHSFGEEKTCNMYEVAAWTLHVCKLHWNLRGEDLARALQAAVWCIGPWGDSRHNFRDVWTLSEHLLLSQLSCLGIEFQTTIERQAVAAGSPCVSKRIPNCKPFTQFTCRRFNIGGKPLLSIFLAGYLDKLSSRLSSKQSRNKQESYCAASRCQRERDIYIDTHTCSEKSQEMEIYHEFVQKSYGNNIGQHLKPK